MADRERKNSFSPFISPLFSTPQQKNNEKLVRDVEEFLPTVSAKTPLETFDLARKVTGQYELGPIVRSAEDDRGIHLIAGRDTLLTTPINHYVKSNTYIGGSPEQTRKKYLDLYPKITEKISKISQMYGLPNNFLPSLLSVEGSFIDDGINNINSKRGYSYSPEGLSPIDRYDPTKDNYISLKDLGYDIINEEGEWDKILPYLQREIPKPESIDFVNERGEHRLSGIYDGEDSFDNALELLGAKSKQLFDLVERDAKAAGINLTDEQKQYWANVYWNSGESKGPSLLRQHKGQYINPTYNGKVTPGTNGRKFLRQLAQYKQGGKTKLVKNAEKLQGKRDLRKKLVKTNKKSSDLKKPRLSKKGEGGLTPLGQEGGTLKRQPHTVDEAQQKIWLDNWLTSRRDKFVQNFKDEEKGTSLNPFKGSKTKRANEYLDKRLNHIRGVDIYSSRDNREHTKFKNSLNLGEADRNKLDRSNHFSQGSYFNSIANPDTEHIYINEDRSTPTHTTEATRVHELSHAFHPLGLFGYNSPMLSKINTYKKDNEYRNPDIERDSYLDDNNEIYSRLNELRFDSKISPNKTVTEGDLENFRKSGLLEKSRLDRYTNKFLLYLLNDVAYKENSQTPMAKKGQKINWKQEIRKHQSGGSIGYSNYSLTPGLFTSWASLPIQEYNLQSYEPTQTFLNNVYDGEVKTAAPVKWITPKQDFQAPEAKLIDSRIKNEAPKEESQIADMGQYVNEVPSRRKLSGDKSEFINQFTPIFENSLSKIGASKEYVPFLLAQSALESGWGKSESGKYNLSGIKDPSKKGSLKRTREVINGQDTYINDYFRDFEDYQEWADYYVNLLNNKRYNAFNGEDFISSVVQGGYATDPNYAKLLRKVFNSIKDS